MRHQSCCVVNCKNTSRKSKCKFYKFPTAKWKINQRNQWIAAVRRLNADGSSWVPKPHDCICSDHFIGGKKSEEALNPSYIPTIFSSIYKSYKVNESSATYSEMPRRRTLTGRKERNLNRSYMNNARERKKSPRDVGSNFYSENSCSEFSIIGNAHHSRAYINPHKRNKVQEPTPSADPDGSPWISSRNSYICSDHFIGGKKSEEQLSSSYLPTIFPEIYQTNQVFKSSRIQSILKSNMQRKKSNLGRCSRAARHKRVERSKRKKQQESVSNFSALVGEEIVEIRQANIHFQEANFQFIENENIKTEPLDSEHINENVDIPFVDVNNPVLVKEDIETWEINDCFENENSFKFIKNGSDQIDPLHSIGDVNNSNTDENIKKLHSEVIIKDEVLIEDDTIWRTYDSSSRQKRDVVIEHIEQNIDSRSRKAKRGKKSKGKRYACDVCYVSFLHESNLIEHKRIHTGEKPYSCDQCNKTFTWEVSLLGHQLTHCKKLSKSSGEDGNEKKCHCKECCLSLTKQNDSIQVKGIRGKKIYTCFCDKTFTSLASLNAHKKIHSTWCCGVAK